MRFMGLREQFLEADVAEAGWLDHGLRVAGRCYTLTDDDTTDAVVLEDRRVPASR